MASPLAFSLLAFLVFSSLASIAEAYDSLDPNGNITIKWDIIQWTPDGYVAVVTMYNYQQYRHIQSPGWNLGWTWAKKEVIWSMVGAQTTEQGDCSKFKGNIPHCCKKTPTIVDLLPGTPYNMQIANCCKGGVISSWVQDPANAASSFQLSAGLAGTSKKTVRAPKNFTLRAPGPGYTCGPAKDVSPSTFLTSDGRRKTHALSKDMEHYLYILPVSCTEDPYMLYSPYLAYAVNDPSKSSYAPLVQCTSHMCPIRVHWHVKLNYKDYWRVKIAITNFNYRMNYTQWNLVIQHPNFDNLTQLFSFNYRSIAPYGDINDTAMLWGVKYYNDLLMEAGPYGNAQSELLFRKEPSFTFEKGWAFPRRVYFNGDNCVMPPPDAYPWLPNSSPRLRFPSFVLMVVLWAALALSLIHHL
ncbi:hypothetical protein ZIOFF_034955 [Zingiber officinale]|uniref:COBRA-like protein n=1 Tax=Zingiber officinale TaxID=94328 RepID=A0A8J5GFK1_ZINOF|nr:hypothetical protein ZIOFF_034955 [Zingiber officinale]